MFLVTLMKRQENKLSNDEKEITVCEKEINLQILNIFKIPISGEFLHNFFYYYEFQ